MRPLPRRALIDIRKAGPRHRGIVTGIVATVLGVLILVLLVVGISLLRNNPELQREFERQQQR